MTDEDDSSELEDEEEELKTVFGQLQDHAEHCKDLIEDIRRTEFGIGEVLDEKGGDLLRRNNDRLCRSMDRLSKELYAKDTHFVLELIQNADDNSYDEDLMRHDSEERPSVAFIVDQDSIVVLNNERGFEDSNIRAICDVGKSTKGAHRKGYIGLSGYIFLFSKISKILLSRFRKMVSFACCYVPLNFGCHLNSHLFQYTIGYC